MAEGQLGVLQAVCGQQKPSSEVYIFSLETFRGLTTCCVFAGRSARPGDQGWGPLGGSPEMLDVASRRPITTFFSCFNLLRWV